MNQRRGAVQCDAMNSSRQVFVQVEGGTRAWKVDRESSEELMEVLRKR